MDLIEHMTYLITETPELHTGADWSPRALSYLLKGMERGVLDPGDVCSAMEQ